MRKRRGVFGRARDVGKSIRSVNSAVAAKVPCAEISRTASPDLSGMAHRHVAAHAPPATAARLRWTRSTTSS